FPSDLLQTSFMAPFTLSKLSHSTRPPRKQTGLLLQLVIALATIRQFQLKNPNVARTTPDPVLCSLQIPGRTPCRERRPPSAASHPSFRGSRSSTEAGAPLGATAGIGPSRVSSLRTSRTSDAEERRQAATSNATISAETTGAIAVTTGAKGSIIR
ncbi:hypothetical protein GOODEAATRI_025404, partial [Goodea atripinnis]